MAHAGGVRPSVEMVIRDGVLHVGKPAQRIGVVSDVDLAIQRLLSGEVVYVQQFGATVTQVERTIAATLAADPQAKARGKE